MATGTRRRVYDGSNIVTVAGFRPDGARLALLHDRGYGDTTLLLLDLDSGTASPFGSARQFLRRPLVQ
ncbi:MAG: hypothetical protein WDN25_16300 [Acetobacteraceae bacterium]